MSLTINEVIDIQLQSPLQGLSRRDMSICALITSETGKVFTDTEKTYIMVSNIDEVASLFGTSSEVYKACLSLFATTPRVKKVIIGKRTKQGKDNAEGESIVDALTRLENVYQNWYGLYFVDELTQQELLDAHAWIVANNSKIMAYTFLGDVLQIEKTNAALVSLAKMQSGRIMVQYNKQGNKHAGLELLALAVNTNWTGLSTSKTIKFKQFRSVEYDSSITTQEAQICKDYGINFYTDYNGVPMIAEGMMLGGKFIDEITGLDAFTNMLQTELFNVLKTEPTKIPRTEAGQAILLAAAVRVGEQFFANGFLGSGIWRGGAIGSLDDGDILNRGYYFYSSPFSEQSESDKKERKMMPIMCALKLAGAGHSVDIIIKYNT